MKRRWRHVPQRVGDAVGDTRAYLGEPRKSGHDVAAEALESVEKSTTVRVRNGKAVDDRRTVRRDEGADRRVFVIDDRDLDDVIHVAAGFPSAKHGSIEVRPIRDLGP